MNIEEQRAEAALLVAEGHWNDDDIEAAHERLFDRVDGRRVAAGISMAKAVQMTHQKYLAGELSAQLMADMALYNERRASMAKFLRPPPRVPVGAFAYWMETGQIVEPGAGFVLRLKTEDRRVAFDELMAVFTAGTAAGLTLRRAVMNVILEARESTVEQPNRMRTLLQDACGRGGHRAPHDRYLGLPSDWTVMAWFRRHRGETVQRLDGEPKPVRVPASVHRTLLWKARVRVEVLGNPSVSLDYLYRDLMGFWKRSWGRRITMEEFVAEAEVARQAART